MVANPDLLVQPGQALLEITEAMQAAAERQSQTLASARDRWQVYCNRLALDAVLSWLQQEEAAAELVGGTAISLEGARLVAVPSEATDWSELRVPQERIDLAGWTGDYYLGVQLQPEEGWACLWGYATHERLKARGTYDASDRSYALAAEHLTCDLSAFGVERQLCPRETTQAAVDEPPALSSPQAENLLERLSDPECFTPRLAVPFAQWGALIAHDSWRQQLFERRQGLPEQRSVVQWLQAGVSQLAQQAGWQQLAWQPGLAGARDAERQAPAAIFARPLTIAGQAYELRLIPSGPPEERVWRFELQPGQVGTCIPQGWKLRLLSEDLQPFEGNEAVAAEPVDRLYIEVALAQGEGVVWETEPRPEGHAREVLRF